MKHIPKHFSVKNTFFFPVFLLWVLSSVASAQIDRSFFSRSFDTVRWYRIYLPENYEKDTFKRYPVIYYFHGWGGRYKWDSYDLSDDPNYPANGRVEPPFVMEWKNYVKSHDVIIVSWDGYEPHLHPGRLFREGIPYGQCNPYDYPRAHEHPIVQWGWDFRTYFRDLVAHIDSNYRTIPDRDHRGITGLSMGGLTSLYISGQNKDLISSTSAFCPADNIPLYGPKGYLAAFPVLEMYRSLKGIPLRLSYNSGDWLLFNDQRLKRIVEGSGFTPFESHLADFPDHWAADAGSQLDFHMREFEKKHKRPEEWDHICPAFRNFDQWGYRFSIQRPSPALTILENVSRDHLTVYARKFIPNGPVVQDETVSVTTDSIYQPDADYELVVYNLTSQLFSSLNVTSSRDGRLTFSLPGGGHMIGIHRKKGRKYPDIRVEISGHPDYLYFEEGKPLSLDLNLVNLGSREAKNITLEIKGHYPTLHFTAKQITIPSLAAGERIKLDSVFSFSFSHYDDQHITGNLQIRVSAENMKADTRKFVFFAIPPSPYVHPGDIIILDGRKVSNVRIYDQANDTIVHQTLEGGKGNGNGIPEPGEEVLVFLHLAQGLAPGDTNTFHKTYLIGDNKDPYISVNHLRYDEKIGQAGATSISSLITISDQTPPGHKMDLWFRVESLYNDYHFPFSRTHIYEFSYDHRHIFLQDVHSE